MLKIEIETIPHSQQRYDTAGDWYFEGGVLKIKVSDLGNEPQEFCVALHELVEVMLCKHRGVTQEEVDAFDLAFSGPGEPGDDLCAPYFREHQFSMGMERLYASQVGLNWSEYERRLEELSQ